MRPLLKKFDNYLVTKSTTAYECLVKFEANNVHTVLVVNDDLVLGTVTDGDIRKSLINFRLLTIPACEVMNSHFIYGKSIDECQKLAKKYSHLLLFPVIDGNRRLQDIYIVN